MLFNLEGGCVVRVGPDPDSLIGAICPKGRASTEFLYHPNRLLYPLRRSGARGENRWQRISWDEALDEMAGHLDLVRQESGPEYFALAQGTGRPYIDFTSRFANAFGTPNFTGIAHNCMSPRTLASLFTVGSLMPPVPDHYGFGGQTPRCLLIWGSNTAEIGSAHGIGGEAVHKAIQEAQELIVVDPRKTNAARKATQWLQLRPGTDGALALAMIHVIIAEGTIDEAFVSDYTTGFAELRAFVRPFAPEWAAEITRIPAEEIRAAALGYATTKPAALQWGSATDMSVCSHQTARSLMILRAITGNLDRPGSDAFWVPPQGVNMKSLFVNPEMAGKLFLPLYPLCPIAHPPTFWHSIVTGDPYRVRALWIMGSNPLVNTPTSLEVEAALRKLEYLVVSPPAHSTPEPPARALCLNRPRHVAIVMDGNGRWASARGLARRRGHALGANVATEIYQAARRMGIEYLTLYAFSVANWQRPEEEVSGLMELFANYALAQRDDLLRRDIRFQIIGDLGPVPEATRRQLERTAEVTRRCRGMVLSTAINYGARCDLVGAVRSIARRVEAGELSVSDIDEATLRQRMFSSSLPDPDLLIRTGGEVRLSDFLLFECAYTELFFSDIMWPDFTEADLKAACDAFGNRERRFGLLGRWPKSVASRPCEVHPHRSGAGKRVDGPSLLKRESEVGFAEVASNQDHARCARAVREQDSVVATAMSLLPEEQRRALTGICAWCWRADNLLDNGPQDDLAWLDRQYHALVAELDDIYAGRPLGTPEARALRDATHRFRISQAHLDRFMDGIGMDRRIRRYETFEQLLVYCRAVLAPVTVLATEVLGYRSANALGYASLMGVAMQLSNICRDVGEDLARGRVYLPAEELARFGVIEDDLGQGQVTEPFAALMRFQIARARWCYAEAERGISNVASLRGRCAALALGRLYALKLTAVEGAGYDCLTAKPRTSNGQCLAAVARALIEVGALARPPILPPVPDPRTFRGGLS